MGLRTRLVSRLSATVTSSVVRLLDAALRELIDEALEARNAVHQHELASALERLDLLRRELAERRSAIDALRQSVEAFAREAEDRLEDDLSLIDASDRLATIESAHDESRRKLIRAEAALDISRAQVEALDARIAELGGRVDKATQLARSALTTAESAADGVSAIEASAARGAP